MNDTDSAPFISDPAGSFAEEDRAEPTSSISEYVSPFETTKQLFRSIGGGVARYGQIGEWGEQLSEPEPAVPPDTLNQKYGIPGKLTFDSPLPDSVGQSMYQAKIEEIKRASVRERAPSGVLPTASRYGAQFMADMLDPVNLAAVMVPSVPEFELGASVAARLASRGIAGAASGAVGMAPLVGLKYVMGRQEQSDYDAYNAISDIAVGAGMGAVLHVGGGLLSDYLTNRVARSRGGRIIADSPKDREALLKTSVSQLASDDPVEVRPLLPPDASMEMEPGGRAPFPERSDADVSATAVVRSDSPISSDTEAARHHRYWLSVIAEQEQGVRQIGQEAGRGEHTFDEARRQTAEAQGAIEQARARLAENINFIDGSRYEGSPAPSVGEPPPHVTDVPIAPDLSAASAGKAGAQPTIAIPAAPMRLASFLIQDGGLRDSGGDVRATMGGVRGRPGLLNSKGRSLDDAALNAWQAGYFPGHGDERPSINELLEALDDDLRGVPRYSHFDDAAVQNYHDALAHNNEIDRLSSELGISTQNVTREQFFDQVRQHLTEDDFDARVGTYEQSHVEDYQQAEEMAKEWVALHASPHDFDRFDTSKIGTGEGAQSYGHGLYFAEGEGTHQFYLNSLARLNRDDDFVFDGKAHHADVLDDFYRDTPAARPGITAMMDNNFDAKQARIHLEQEVAHAGNWSRLIPDETIREDIARFDPSDKSHSEALASVTPEQIAERRAMFQRQEAADKEYAERGLEWFDQHKDRIAAPEKGRVNSYRVQIKARPEEMLDWDKPSSEQSPTVRAAMKRLMPDLDIDHHGVNGGRAFYEEFSHRQAKPDPDPMAQQPFNDNLEASRLLHDAGIKGIRYLDRQSRDLTVTQIPEPMHDAGKWQVHRQDRDGGFDPIGEPHETKEAAEKAAGFTHNVVVFDHDDVEITHKNGEPVEHHAPSEAEAREISETRGQEPHGGFDAEQFYGKDQVRTLEDLEREHQQEAASVAARERGGGDEPVGPTGSHPGGIQEGAGLGGHGAGNAGRQGQGTGEAPGRGPIPADRAATAAADHASATDAAIRAASGERPPGPAELAADAAVKETPERGMKLAAEQIEDHEEFFRRAEAAGALTEEVRAELEAINNLDKEAKDYGQGAIQAAACVARGLAGGNT